MFIDWSHYFSENLVVPGIEPRNSLTTEVTCSSKNDKFNLLTAKSRGARITTGYRLGDWCRIECQQGQEFFTSRLALGPIQPPQWVPGCGAHSPPTGALVKKTCIYTP
jgi:hypothetical protein